MNRPDISRLKRNRSIYLKLGFIISISLTIMAFNYTVYDVPTYTFKMEPIQEEDLIDVQRTVQEKKKLPPPPAVQPSSVIEKQEMEFIEVPDPEPIVNEIVVAPKPVINTTPVLLKIPEVKKPVVIEDDSNDDHGEIFEIVEQMPRFPGCEGDELDEKAMKYCSDKKLLEFLATNIKYPSIAKENNIEGTAVVTFVVEKDGSITGLKVVREIGGGCGREVMRVVQKMPDWIPGEQRRKKVRVQFNLPVKFTLD